MLDRYYCPTCGKQLQRGYPCPVCTVHVADVPLVERPLATRLVKLDALLCDVNVALHRQHQKCGCYGKMHGPCPSCQKLGALEDRVTDALVMVREWK